MTALLLALALALPAAAAWSVISRLDPEPARSAMALAFRAGASCIIGAGMTTLVTYAWLVGGGTLGRGYAVFDAALLLGTAVLVRPRGTAPLDPPRPPLSRVDAAAVVLVAASALLLLAALVHTASYVPHGQWDAWSIWNVRARFLFRSGAEWRGAFDKELYMSHPEYPLLVPLAVARLWAFVGETTAAPTAIAVAFSLAPILVLAGAIGRKSGAVAGASAALLLAATDKWVHAGVAQYADVPLAALLATAFAFFLLAHDRSPPRRTLLALAGTCVGLCTWTKEGGILFAVVLFAWTAVWGKRPPGTLWARSALARVSAFAAGAALPLVARVHFQIALSPGFAPTFTEGQTPGTTLSRILDPGRWLTIASHMPSHVPGIAWGLPFVAIAVSALLGARPRDVLRSPILLPLLAIYAAFLLVYAGTPMPLEWHITNSAKRVLLQAWPALLIAIFSLTPAQTPIAPGCARL